MFRRLLIAICLLLPVVANAGEISDFDVATYALTRADGQPTGMQMRLTRVDGKWVMEGTVGDGPWKNISCDVGCDYRASSSSETESYLASFPAEMQNRFDIACIQNMANAFCRLTNKENPSQGGYALVALVTEKPVPMSLQRLTRPYPSDIPLQKDASPPSGWIDMAGKPIPDTENMRSAGDFGIHIVLTANEGQFRQTWNSSATPPKLTVTNTVRLGERVSALLIFHGCAPNFSGICDVVSEFILEGPDGSKTPAGGGPVWSGKPMQQRRLQLGQASMTVVFDKTGPIGDYKVTANVTDKVSGQALSVMARLKVTK